MTMPEKYWRKTLEEDSYDDLKEVSKKDSSLVNEDESEAVPVDMDDFLMHNVTDDAEPVELSLMKDEYQVLLDNFVSNAISTCTNYIPTSSTLFYDNKITNTGVQQMVGGSIDFKGNIEMETDF